MLCYEGRLSLYCFVSAIFSLALLWVFFDLGIFADPEWAGFWARVVLLAVYYLGLNVVIWLKFATKDYQVSLKIEERIVFISLKNDSK